MENIVNYFTSSVGAFIGLIAIIYIVYRLIRLMSARTNIYYLKQNGKFIQEGFVKYNSIKDRFNGYDITRDFADQKISEIQVADDGKAWVRLKKENQDFSNPQFENIGYIDIACNIYDKNHCKVGYIGNVQGMPGMEGKRKWYELFLRCHSYVFLYAQQEEICSNAGEPPQENPPAGKPQDVCIGKCIQTGRFRKTHQNEYSELGRAAALLLLYQKVKDKKPKSETSTAQIYEWADTALISTLIFTAIYGIFYFTSFDVKYIPVLGSLGHAPSMIVLFLIIWVLIRQVKIEQMLNGKPVNHFLMLLNRNTGVNGIGNLISICLAISLFISFYFRDEAFVPLQLVMLAGITINKKFITKSRWQVNDKFLVLPPEDFEDEEDTANKIAREYQWQLDSDYSTSHGELQLYFSQAEIDDLRGRNPFRTEASRSFSENIRQLFKEPVDENHLKRINHYIKKKAYEENLSELEAMQFILDFAQEPNIKYILDEESPETGGVEYARYPVETLFDKRGDCDCKAVLAAALFRNAGYKTAYVTSHNHAAIAVACPKEWFQYTSSNFFENNDAITDKNGQFYYFCETTGDNFRIGDYGTSNRDEFTDFIFLE